MRFRMLMLIVGIVALLMWTGGCQASAGGTSSFCVTARNTYNVLSAAELTAQNEVGAEQAAIALLPANDPARKTLQGPLLKAQAVLAQIQSYLTLAKIGVATLCPEAAIPVSLPASLPTTVVQPVPPGDTR